MYALFAVLVIIVCLLLMLVILVQNPKGGGLSSAFGGGNQMFGVKQTTDFLDKSTWTLAAVLVGLILLSNVAIDRGGEEIQDTNLREQMENTAPVLPPSSTEMPPVQQEETE
jgi:preprotein translocase subunit SecG